MKETFKGSPNIVTPVMEERIIKVAYQDGSWFDRWMVHYVRKQNPKVERLYQAHLAAVRDVRLAGNEIMCSDRLSNRLLEIATPESGLDRVPISALLKRGYFAFQATTALAAVLVLTVALIHQFRGPSVDQRELEEATQQAKASLALISEIMNGTRDSINDEVILMHTAKPIHDSIFKGTETIKRNI